MKEAMLYDKLGDGKVKCNLCNHRCIIAPLKRGVCGVRENREGILYSLVYNKAISRNIDPIEKKPVFHLFPGSESFSIATAGCNFKCLHCQNSDISQMPRDQDLIPGRNLEPKEIVSQALQYNCKSISYTYTEPTIFFEYAYDTAEVAHKEGIKNVFVTNGYMTKEALHTIRPYLDAANVDLKSFSDEFYKEICGAKLNFVLDSIRTLKELGVWIEITTLIIPTLNDGEEELKRIAEFIREVGEEIPWHVSAFHPTYKLLDRPRTSAKMLHRAREIGLGVGLRYVYCGNIPGDEGENTYCYTCKELLIQRYGYQILKNRIKDGLCPDCGTKIDGIGLG
ncbi:MAG: AmmeMemoRadiSam system radical SAM enzyme [Deltaproteobacteria bacterium CG_4_9_14_3_um_filter_44_9]|nr:MAG: AmmeMemoRadiSam system radical SAM enzyme [Deltaproteobacteria bacterium CG_4_8_14_3_um_filter_43_13]PIZ19732.1 MAG: AmmeMemoRadiSam system radical SAM enzyme [Deltaproteobacteria bacterium CG_4_10_14_0_8_um_filter_43_12]PJB38417.1 MAG: AmmeMemoRadiSam system radical SAM enzyme [Deltaproteobacteria bacterium CG_4_9_14_3_um_filter_44_9]HCX90318.1 AmmeMemoRadiSam system radical SAM enzyme [Deltaproteobacteria bacterium]